MPRRTLLNNLTSASYADVPISNVDMVSEEDRVPEDVCVHCGRSDVEDGVVFDDGLRCRICVEEQDG